MSACWPGPHRPLGGPSAQGVWLQDFGFRSAARRLGHPRAWAAIRPRWTKFWKSRTSSRCTSPRPTQTRKIINAARLAKFKKGAILINVSRGDLVDTDALVDALKSGQLSAPDSTSPHPEPIPAGHPLRSLDNVVFTSHVASASMPKAIHPPAKRRGHHRRAGSHRQAGLQHRQRRPATKKSENAGDCPDFAESASKMGLLRLARQAHVHSGERTMAKNWMMDHDAQAIRVQVDDLSRFVVDVP